MDKLDKLEKKAYSALEPDSQKLHIVVDTETLAINPQAAVTEIAGHVLGKDEWFCVRINPTKFQELDFTTNSETVEWHEKRDKNYLKELIMFGEEPAVATVKFVDWIYTMEDKYQAHAVIWTRGIDFDIPILTHLLSHYGFRNPWHYRNVRDIRTLGALLPEIKVTTGDHSALGDVRAAATYMSQLAYAHPMISNMLGIHN